MKRSPTEGRRKRAGRRAQREGRCHTDGTAPVCCSAGVFAIVLECSFLGANEPGAALGAVAGVVACADLDLEG